MVHSLKATKGVAFKERGLQASSTCDPWSQVARTISLKRNRKILYYKALPRGNTSSGNVNFSCGWS